MKEGCSKSLLFHPSAPDAPRRVLFPGKAAGDERPGGVSNSPTRLEPAEMGSVP